MSKKEIQEASHLRWVADTVPLSETPEDAIDKLLYLIKLYSIAGAKKIEELSEALDAKDNEIKELRNDLIDRLNNNAIRYVGGVCNGTEYPEVETFEVDEIYEIIDRVFDRIPEDNGEVD